MRNNMIEILDEIASLEIKSGDKRILIMCNRLERFEYGIIGYLIKKKFFGESKEQVLIIHTNVERKIKETQDLKPNLEVVTKANFNSIKEVLDSLCITINWRTSIMPPI